MGHQPNLESEPSSKSSSDSATGSGALRISFLTLFPEAFDSVLNASLLGKAQQRGLVSFQLVPIRQFATDKHRTTDDTPYGGGEGMVLKPDTLYAAWEYAGGQRPAPAKTATILLSPQGKVFNQEMAKELAQYSHLILVCGHYEGVDERFIDLCVDREVSIGDYVLTGGELPAMVMADSITRLIPGVVGNERSLSQDSLEQNLLKYPQFTRPRDFRGLSVPEVLLSGDHKAIAAWREAQARERTLRKRPDLLEKTSKDSGG
jgi:tRNA (guanine37-N1)-methyltransferase